jgi:formate hydrogenlyase subunit 3/multisubunit Na+/H+ antiporter MnhD subunit
MPKCSITAELARVAAELDKPFRRLRQSSAKFRCGECVDDVGVRDARFDSYLLGDEIAVIGPFVFGLLLPVVAGCAALALHRRPDLASRIAAGSIVASSVLTGGCAICSLATGATASIKIPWNVPLGSLSLGMDPLSAAFVLPISILASAAALYGRDYLTATVRPGWIARSWFFFNSLVAAMLLVVSARNGLLFLFAWEAMSLASFFLVLTEYDHDEVRHAAWVYAVAAHIGTACLLVLFLLLGRGGSSLDFEQFTPQAAFASAAFILALIGFGTKAGFVALHVWLPEAHPAAPSHVSALMSGVMIKTGIYGLLRTLTFLGEVQPLWGWTLLGIGLATALYGVVFAIAQQDLKRMLAYSSVENIGIISIGLGTGLLGLAYNIPAMAACALMGSMLHILNHSLFKGVMFLGAGAIQLRTRTRDMNQLGGLLKRMPWTGRSFLVGALAISGLPPLNGFLGEALIVVGALIGVIASKHAHALPGEIVGVAVVGGLALIGGLSVACFTRAFGCVFLGEPRSQQASSAREVDGGMRIGMLILAAGCLLVSLLAPLWPVLFQSAILALAGGDIRDAVMASPQPQSLLIALGVAYWLLAGVFALVWWLRRRIAGSWQAETGPTWDCGYAAPDPRMQYTASSFGDPFARLFRLLLRTRSGQGVPAGFFPQEARFSSESPDPFASSLFAPAFQVVAWLASKVRHLQHGRIQIYVLYIALTLIALLVWKLD